MSEQVQLVAGAGIVVSKNGRNESRDCIPKVEGPAGEIILRFEDVPATPRNLEHVRERVRLLNQRLAESDTPFRLRVM